MSEVDAGKVDVIVVYKVDRLTRSLADFAKIVERMDAKQASFVSVTQAFNMTSSMGRLTLNVLLSFAQFEREVTGERIRDKIAASKKKGLWMGGPVPLGYVVQDRKLIAEPAEAEQVRSIMRSYIACASVPALLQQLEAEGVTTKVQNRVSGPHRGGIPFKRGSLFHLLKNPIYRGMIVHKGQVYPGEHEAIVDEDLWGRVQQCLTSKAPPRRKDKNQAQYALLEELLFDQQGRPMVPSYTSKGSRRYRYYETRYDLVRKGRPATRFQMGLLDRHILTHLQLLLADKLKLQGLTAEVDGKHLAGVFAGAEQLRQQLDSDPKTALHHLISKIRAQAEHLSVELRLDENGNPETIQLPMPARKPFRETKLVLGQQARADPVDEKLLTLLRDAADAQELVLASPELALHKIAQREGRCRKQLTQLLKLSWLSPKIVTAKVRGSNPTDSRVNF